MHKRVKAELARLDRPWRVWEHASLQTEIRSPADFAAAVDVPLDRIVKTILLADRKRLRDQQPDDRTRFGAISLSADAKANFKQAASMFGWSAAEVATPAELDALLDYPSRGVSPIGLVGLPLVMDQAVTRHSTIFIGAGTAGVEVELEPDALQWLTGCQVVNLVSG